MFVRGDVVKTTTTDEWNGRFGVVMGDFDTIDFTVRTMDDRGYPNDNTFVERELGLVSCEKRIANTYRMFDFVA